jgi:hypothetical protein
MGRQVFKPMEANELRLKDGIMRPPLGRVSRLKMAESIGRHMGSTTS